MQFGTLAREDGGQLLPSAIRRRKAGLHRRGVASQRVVPADVALVAPAQRIADYGPLQQLFRLLRLQEQHVYPLEHPGGHGKALLALADGQRQQGLLDVQPQARVVRIVQRLREIQLDLSAVGVAGSQVSCPCLPHHIRRGPEGFPVIAEGLLAIVPFIFPHPLLIRRDGLVDAPLRVGQGHSVQIVDGIVVEGDRQAAIPVPGHRAIAAVAQREGFKPVGRGIMKCDLMLHTRIPPSRYAVPSSKLPAGPIRSASRSSRVIRVVISRNFFLRSRYIPSISSLLPVKLHLMQYQRSPCRLRTTSFSRPKQTGQRYKNRFSPAIALFPFLSPVLCVPAPAGYNRG